MEKIMYGPKGGYSGSFFRQDFYLPFNFYATSSDYSEYEIDINVDDLREFHKKFNIRRLITQKWELEEIEVPNTKIKEFQYLCFEIDHKDIDIIKAARDIIENALMETSK